MNTFRITHTTRYVYTDPVSRCHNEARMSPMNLPHQTCAFSKVHVSPSPRSSFQRIDYFGNNVFSFDIHQQHQELTISVISEVAIDKPCSLSLENSLPWDQFTEHLEQANKHQQLMVHEFILPSPQIPQSASAKDYALSSFTPGRPLLDAVNDLTHRIYNDFKYEPGFSSLSTPLETVIEHRKGVCQDFAHLAIACLRSMGLPAMYVSGYLETDPPPGKPKLTGADASHAWLNVFIPEHGWQGFDPTNNQMANERYIVVAQGRDYADVTPLKGVVYGGGHHHLTVQVDVTRTHSHTFN
ncbi:transglutaminase family protein [Zooshikella ganghwensis]|uniref:transglutaminase family protein n=1 Tax=Zooshikella ganghwensis TaxID=202772 RepID=UPI00041383A6|nr:transglutaminase family protein [Zooshikella ganghwensis]